MFHKQHKTYIKRFYKTLLSEASIFFDDRTRQYIADRTRSIFKEYKKCEDVERVKYKIREGRKWLHRLEDANRGNHRSALKILEEAYGRKGKIRHSLLFPYLNMYQTYNIFEQPFVPHVPHTAPPPKLCPPLKAIVLQHSEKRLEPILPVPEYKPLHVGRKANLLWRHRSMLLSSMELPLPFEIICELERKAGATIDHPMACSTRMIGGPKFNDFYYPVKNKLPHLQPDLKMKPHSKLQRTQLLNDSPYTANKPNLLDFLGKTSYKNPKKSPAEYTTHKQRRLYRRLLLQVPIIDIFSANELWLEDKKYKITKSHWEAKGVTQVLKDIPPQDVIKATISPKKNAKKGSSPRTP